MFWLNTVTNEVIKGNKKKLRENATILKYTSQKEMSGLYLIKA